MAKHTSEQNSLVDFLDTWQFDDEANSFTFEEYLANPSNPRFTDVQTTYGIRNTTQIERWIEGFKTALKKARGKWHWKTT
jgi:hypothetical protein